MRLFITYIILFCAFTSANIVYWVDYNDNISNGSPVQANTQNNIKQSELIEKYIINYKSKIKNLESRYEIQNSKIINENVDELDKMIIWLRKTQTSLVEKDDAAELIKSVVDGLKIVNNNLKPYLKIKQREYENKVSALRLKHAETTKRISAQINILIKQIADPMKKERKLSLNQKQIIKHLIVLEEESKKLYNFWNRNFETTQELKSYVRNIIKTVRIQLQEIRRLI